MKINFWSPSKSIWGVIVVLGILRGFTTPQITGVAELVGAIFGSIIGIYALAAIARGIWLKITNDESDEQIANAE